MAGTTLAAYTDGYVEKVLVGETKDNLTFEPDNSDNRFHWAESDGRFVKPIFQEGYELDTFSEDGAEDKGDGVYYIGGFSITFTSKPKTTNETSIDLTTSNGIKIKTAGKYVADDIKVIPALQEKTVTPTTSQQEVTPSDGYCGLDKVTVGAIQVETADITPSKGTQTVQPTSGKYFSQVTVEPIPDDYVIPSGTQQITENGTYDVSGKATVVVNVPSGVEEVASGETWVLNEILLDFDRGDQSYFNYAVNFVSNGTQYTNIACVATQDIISRALAYDHDTRTIAYDGSIGAWSNDSYRTITFETAPTGDLLTWLQANGTKQGGGEVTSGYTVTINYDNYNTAGIGFYSTDAGNTWVDCYVAGQSQLVLNNVEQIMFKAVPDYEHFISIISRETPNMLYIYASESGTESIDTLTSENNVLKDDVTVRIASGMH